jgi:hypothetical protein
MSHRYVNPRTGPRPPLPTGRASKGTPYRLDILITGFDASVESDPYFVGIGSVYGKPAAQLSVGFDTLAEAREQGIALGRYLGATGKRRYTPVHGGFVETISTYSFDSKKRLQLYEGAEAATISRSLRISDY